jgi:hypothetical protein
MIGVMGEYLCRDYEELKGRPLYIVADERNFAGPSPVESVRRKA